MRYNTHSHALSILALTATILFVFSGPGYSQTADQYFEWGKAYLESGSLVDAHTNFENALSVDPNHNGANFFYALTSILMISESSEFNDLLDQAGVSGTGRDIFNWEADFNRNVYGDVILPPDAPTGADFQDFAKNEVLPVIEGAVSNMENVDDSFLTYFNWAFERGEGSPVMTNTFETYTDYWYTNEWAGFKLIVEGAEYDILSNTHDTLTVSPSLAVGSGTYDYMIIAPIEIDYGDALVLRGGLNLAKAAIRIYTAYNFDADIDTLLPLFYAETFDIQADAIDLYPQFLTLLPTHELAEAKTDIRESITQLNDAIDFILSEVDAQGNDFIVVSASEGAEFKARFTEVDNALDGPVLVEVEELQIQVDLSEFFDDPKNLRDYIPNFYGIRIARGSFPDPTFGGIFPAMTDTELYGYLDEMRILTPSKDFNGDGKADILWRDESNGEVHVWYMDGETRLGTGYIDTVPDMSWKIVAEADFNRDHKPDLLWRQASTGNIVIWFMNGLALTGTASLPSLSGADWEVTGVIDNSKYYRYIFWRNVSTGENIYWRLEGQYYQYSGSLPSLSTAWDAGDVADYNADDIPDIIWRNGSTGENMVWYLNYSGIPTSASLPALADTNWRIVRVFDFSSDGKPDILWHNSATGKNAVWFMNGASKESTANLEDPASANWLIFDVEDASPASLKSDVLFDFGSGTGLWARYNNATWAKLHNLSPEIIAAGDMDGNGQDDGIVDFGPGTGIYVLYNNTTWTKLHSLSAEIIATGDLDGNGKDDCII
ncbi:MAG: VCBS repeat-containing protein, partial [Acidobacteria bacterium]|nr:VCBS repeat-containing protein [Acidobacteriota bacterium]